MSQRRLSQAAAIILVILSYTKASMFNSQPQIMLKAEKNKAFDESCLFATFNIKSGNIADCLEHCLKNCRCQSFQICHETKCQLCSSHKEENSSLLHDKDGCVYATYEMRQSTKTFQKLDDQCSDMSCSMKYNCCQQPDVCPKNKICKPLNSPQQPWKRFTCECPDGYYGDNCDQPITSCGGYLDVPRESGMYKVVDSGNSVYEVYCHFDSNAAWTLLQSYSFANRSLDQIKNPLSKNLPIREIDLTWSGYRLRKPRMKYIKDNSAFLQLTCDYEKHLDIEQSDYVQIPLQDIKQWYSYGRQNESVDFIELSGFTSYINVHQGRGKIGKYDLTHCQISFHQGTYWPLHVHIRGTVSGCTFSSLSCSGTKYFGSYSYSFDCMKKEHRCIQNDNSTTQLWFGARKGSTAQPPPVRDAETSSRYNNN